MNYKMDLEKNKEIRYKDLSVWLKIPVLIGYVIFAVWIMLFLISLIA